MPNAIPLTMRIGFTGKRAVVCKGSRGVGRSVALRYAHDGIRADVVAPGSIEFLSGA
jgi:NAD(P)-dependent dehydrogenase (short-subunit alcohol dehydrogenase family)